MIGPSRSLRRPPSPAAAGVRRGTSARRRARPLVLESLELRTLLAGTPSPLYFDDGPLVAPGQVADFSTVSKWSQPGGLGTPVTLTYAYSNLLDGGLIGGLTVPQLRALAEEALGEWALYAPLNFVEITDPDPPADDNNYSETGHAVIRFGHHAMDGPYNVLAHAYFPGGGGLPGDAHFDVGETWKNTPSGGIDLLEVMVHELGHSLGLGHETAVNAIMNPTYGGRYGGPGTAFLLQDDIDGIRALYGTGVGSVTPLEPPPSAVNDYYALGEDAVLHAGLSSQTPVPKGSTWKYLDNGSNQGTAWRGAAFNDAAWLSGPAQLGYGDGGEATVVGYGPNASNKYVTTYFRKSFTLTDVATIQDLNVRLLRDDGAAVYLNGVEIALDNLAANPAFDTLALATVDGAAEEQFFSFTKSVASLPPGTLVEGTNVLAVEVHQVARNSSDIGFDLEFSVTRQVVDPAPGVLANDTDPQADPLTAVLVAGPTHGALVLLADGRFQYTPQVDYSGPDSFTYRATDGDTTSPTATVTLNVLPAPDLPVAVANAYDVDEDTVLVAGIPQEIVVPAGATWKYLDLGYDEGTAWRQPAYNDAAWASGAAELGYGDGDEATVVRSVNDANTKFATTYFRTTFNVANPAIFTSLTMNLLRDDAAAVYLNGVEVHRDANLAAGAAYNTYATSAIADTLENALVAFSLNPAGLVAGTNTLAVEVHQASGTSSDVGFDLSLVASDGVASTTLLPTGATWKYLDDGTNQGTAWRAAAFNDAAWLSGPAQLGYGEGDEATMVRYARDANNKFATTYFRHAFIVSDVAHATGLQVRVLRDDGVAVYLNGVPLVRDNLAAGATYLDYALSGITGAAESQFLTFNLNLADYPAGTLLEGANLLAAEVHQSDGASSDVSFNLELTVLRNVAPQVLLNDLDPDRTGLVAVLNVPPAHGALNLQAGGNFTYTPAPNYFGPDQFTYHVETAVAEPIVPAGSVWKYLDNGSNQGTAWRAIAFDDAAWASGPAELGYGDGDEKTVVNSGPDNAHYATTYFRKHFSVPDPAAAFGFSLRLKRDDAAAVYLNGAAVPIYRDANLPAGAAYNTYATSGVADENAYIVVSLPAVSLVAGDNVLAVEVHQSGPTSSDVSFDLELLAKLRSAPVVVNLTVHDVPEPSQLFVTNTLDAGPGSLRQAILDANAAAGANTITFAIPGTSPHIIGLASPLPALAEVVTLDVPAGETIDVGGASAFGFPDFAALAKAGAGTIRFGGGDVRIAGTALSIDAGLVKFRDGAAGLLAVDSLAVSPTATLDLADSDLIVHATAGTRQAVLDAVTALLATGAANLAWNGPGINSSAAAADPNLLTALGVMLNDDGLGGAYHASFSGAPAGPNDVLVKYTYYGDADLSGSVDGTDYALVDNGFNASLLGWFNGDSDYSHTIDGTDYALIDNAFNSQGSPLAGSEPAGVGPIPRAASPASNGPSLTEEDSPMLLSKIGIVPVGRSWDWPILDGATLDELALGALRRRR